jgi:hypothetical protein
MSAPATTPEDSGSSILDSLFGTAQQGLDLWTQWTQTKAETTATKAAVPSTVANPTPSLVSGIDNKTLLIGGGIAAVVVVGIVVVAMR